MKRILLLASALLLLSACTDELDQMINGSRSARQATVFQTSTEVPASPETKVYADENMKVLWNADDRISIFNKTTLNSQYVFTGDDGDTAGGFEEVQSGGFFTGNPLDYVYAAYPYSTSNKISNSGSFLMELPAEQAYKEKSFGIGANTMVAITDGSFLAFKNVGGYLSLRLYGDDVFVSRITIKGNNGEKIAGSASIGIPFGGTPAVTVNEKGTDKVSIVCDPAVKIGDNANDYTDFWFVIPPVTFSKGFTITVTDDEGRVFEKSTTKSFTVTRNTLDWMNALKVVPTYENARIQFADANFKAYCVAHFDANEDGEITRAEAQLVTDIAVCTDNIKSLEGIEYFTNLKTLSCTGSLIATKSAAGTYAGQLETIDVKQNSLLESLDCHGNQLISMDLSENHNLTVLDCSNNQLTSLTLYWYGWTLTKLDCSQNRLTTLVFPDGYYFPLKELYCGGNDITALDLSNLSNLEILSCRALPLSTFEIPQVVTTLPAQAFQGCSLLEEVVVPLSVKEIGDQAFADCPLLTAVKMHNETPPSLGNQVFDGSPNCLIYVLSSASETYQTATVWSTYADRLRVFGQTGGHEGIGYDDWE